MLRSQSGAGRPAQVGRELTGSSLHRICGDCFSPASAARLRPDTPVVFLCNALQGCRRQDVEPAQGRRLWAGRAAVSAGGTGSQRRQQDVQAPQRQAPLVVVAGSGVPQLLRGRRLTLGRARRRQAPAEKLQRLDLVQTLRISPGAMQQRQVLHLFQSHCVTYKYWHKWRRKPERPKWAVEIDACLAVQYMRCSKQ